MRYLLYEITESGLKFIDSWTNPIDCTVYVQMRKALGHKSCVRVEEIRTEELR